MAGGCGLVVAIVGGLGVMVLTFGGSLVINLSTAAYLFLLGGIMGLIVLAAYFMGIREGERASRVSKDRQKYLSTDHCPNCDVAINIKKEIGVIPDDETPGRYLCGACGTAFRP